MTTESTLVAHRFEAGDNGLIPGARVEIPAALAAEARAHIAAGQRFFDLAEDGSVTWRTQAEIARLAVEQFPELLAPRIEAARQAERRGVTDPDPDGAAEREAEIKQAVQAAITAERQRAFAILEMAGAAVDSELRRAIDEGQTPGAYAAAVLLARSRGRPH